MFTNKGYLEGQQWVHLGNNWRAVISGDGIDDNGWCYDMIYTHSHGETTARVVESNGKLREQVIFTRKQAALEWLTRKYKQYNEQ